MSNDNLPEKVNPFRLAEAGVSLHGILPLKDMQRLCMSLADDNGQVELSVEFGIDQQGTKFLRGHIETQLMLQCQRCMETFAYGVINDFLSGIVKTDEEAERLSEMYEPVLAEDGMLTIRNVIEDELIVSLPIVPMHNPKECKIDDVSKVVLGSDKASDINDSNPFKVIEILRVKRDTNRNQE